MKRSVLIIALVGAAVHAVTGNVRAQDHAALRGLLGDAAKKELSAKDSKEKSWHDGDSWIWLDNPARNLAVEISSLTVNGDRIAIEGKMSALLGFDQKVSVPLASHTFGGSGRAHVSLKASARIGKQLAESHVRIDRLEITDLRFRSDAARPFQGAIQNGINRLLREKKGDIERALQNALDRLRP